MTHTAKSTVHPRSDTRSTPASLIVLVTCLALAAIGQPSPVVAQTTVPAPQLPENEQRFMQRLEQVPLYPNTVEQLKRQQALYSRELQYRRNAGERIVSANSLEELARGVEHEVQSFLDECKKGLGGRSEDFGIHHVKTRDLDLGGIKLVAVKSQMTGQKLYRVQFDNAFYQQVLKRGRQLKLYRDTNRFRITLFAFAGVFAGLCILYGILKVLSGRAAEKHEDYITTSGISMV